MGCQGWCPADRAFLIHFLGTIAVQKMSGKTPGSSRHPSSRHPWPSEGKRPIKVGKRAIKEGKEGFGVQKPPFSLALTRPGKGSFLSKNPIFPVFPCRRKGIFLTENSLFQFVWKWGFLDPETLFSRKWGFGLPSGVGGIQTQSLSARNPLIHLVRRRLVN